MNDRTNPPVILQLPDRPPDDLDELLRDFFRAELPEPWPAWSAPEAKQDRPGTGDRGRWPALRRRLVLAASVAMLLLGYLALASAFPGSSGTPAGHSDQDTIGKGLDIPGRLHTLPPKMVPVPRGGQAKMWEQHLPDRSIRLQLQILDGPPAHR